MIFRLYFLDLFTFSSAFAIDASFPVTPYSRGDKTGIKKSGEKTRSRGQNGDIRKANDYILAVNYIK
jgi:hypothetical protein